MIFWVTHRDGYNNEQSLSKSQNKTNYVQYYTGSSAVQHQNGGKMLVSEKIPTDSDILMNINKNPPLSTQSNVQTAFQYNRCRFFY